MTVDITLLALAGLATARITSLIVHDAIFEPVRHEIFLISPPADDHEEGLAYQNATRVPWRDRRRGKPSVFRRKGRPPRRVGFVGSMLTCTHCTGVWVAAAVLGALHFAPGPALVVVVFAAVAQIAEATIKVSR